MQEKVLVLHVKKGYEERARHIEQMLHEKGIEFEYVTVETSQTSPQIF